VRAWERIVAVQKRSLAVIRDSLERDMTMPRFELLGSLCRKEGQTLAELSRDLLVKANNLSRIVDRAERDGLCERRADPADRRAWRVHLTPRGQRAFRDAERRHNARVTKIFAGLAPAELATLTSLLDKLRAALREPQTPSLSPQRTAGTRARAERSGVGKRRRTRPQRTLKDPQ
jgi:DNA-binding MarR family transcriptional regulator